MSWFMPPDLHLLELHFASGPEYARVHVGGTATVLEACRRARGSVDSFTSHRRKFTVVLKRILWVRITLCRLARHTLPPKSARKDSSSRSCARLELRQRCRPFSIYGPGLSPQSIIATVIRQARLKTSIVVDDLEPVRDYCYVSDLTEAITRACTVSTSGLCTFNIGTGVGTSVAELAALILGILGRDIPLRERKRKQRPATSQIHSLIADSELAGKILGCSPNGACVPASSKLSFPWTRNGNPILSHWCTGICRPISHLSLTPGSTERDCKFLVSADHPASMKSSATPFLGVSVPCPHPCRKT